VPVPIYAYNAAGGYDTNGNVLGYTDTVMGQWSFAYDQLNRLTTASNGLATLPGTPLPPASNSAPNLCWAYDAFGNRLNQATSDQAFTASNAGCNTSGTLPANTWSHFNSQNQTTTTNAAEIGTLYYDAAGDVGGFGNNQDALYDAEGRICEIFSPSTGWIAYVYDAAGNRVAKGTATVGWSCDISTNGFTQSTEYVVGASGDQLTEMDWGQWAHTNIYAGGRLIGTYDGSASSPTLHFHFDDPLGTRRAQASASGVMEAEYQSLPYGDGYSASGTATDPTENHFTGKERDAESGNDYFLARYYNSATGRFLSPDWSVKVEPVPYAHMDNPQSLNLYSYVQNNPLASRTLMGMDVRQIAAIRQRQPSLRRRW
jgi:RHS repeat-associated protein